MHFLATCGSELFAVSERIAFFSVAFMAGIMLASITVCIRQQSFVWTGLSLLILLLHPAWLTLQNRSDCGYSMRFLSVLSAVTMAVIFVCQVWRSSISKRRFFVWLCLVLWAVYLMGWPMDRISAILWFRLALDAGFFG